MGFKGWNFSFCAITSLSTCLPGWEISANGPPLARGSGWEGAWPAGDSPGCFLRYRRRGGGGVNNTSYDSMYAALLRHVVEYSIIQWIRAILVGLLVMATQWFSHADCSIQGMPTGGCVVTTSLVPCCCCFDSNAQWGWDIYSGLRRWLLSFCSRKIPKHDVRTHAVGPSYHRDMMQRDGPSVYSDETELVVFTRNRKHPGFFEPNFFSALL
jgi:hypothetical protein